MIFFILQARVTASKFAAYAKSYAQTAMEYMSQGMDFAKAQAYSGMVVLGDMTAELRRNITAKLMVSLYLCSLI